VRRTYEKEPGLLPVRVTGGGTGGARIDTSIVYHGKGSLLNRAEVVNVLVECIRVVELYRPAVHWPGPKGSYGEVARSL
jgi:hypothetical protein